MTAQELMVIWGNAPETIASLQKELEEARMQLTIREYYLSGHPPDGMPHTHNAVSSVEAAILMKDLAYREFKRTERTVARELSETKKNEALANRYLRTLNLSYRKLLTEIYRNHVQRQAVSELIGRSKSWVYDAEKKALSIIDKRMGNKKRGA